MKRPRKPFLDPQSQLRSLQRNEIPSFHAVSKVLRAFTVGTGNPDPSNPTMALAALSALLPASDPKAGWMVVPFVQTHAGLETIRALMRQTLLPDTAIFCVAGKDSSAIVWVFQDLSCLLTQATPDGLRLFPGVLYLRTRDSAWTAKVLRGRGHHAKPVLRFSKVYPFSMPNPPKAAQDPESGFFQPNDLAGLPAGVEGRSGISRTWALALRSDVDHFAPIFERLEGYALWPAFVGQEAAEDGFGQIQADGRASRWPVGLPLRGLPEPQAVEMARYAQETADWIVALRQHLGLPFRVVMVRPIPELPCAREVMVLQDGGFVRNHGVGAQPNPLIAFRLDASMVQAWFPPALGVRVAASMSRPLGLAYRIESETSRVQAHPWMPHVGLGVASFSAHTLVSLFADTGMPSPAMARLWRGMFQGQ